MGAPTLTETPNLHTSLALNPKPALRTFSWTSGHAEMCSKHGRPAGFRFTGLGLGFGVYCTFKGFLRGICDNIDIHNWILGCTRVADVPVIKAFIP